MALSKYVVADGHSIKVAKDRIAKGGEVVELDAEWVKQVDPHGERFHTEKKAALMAEKKRLEKQIAALSDEEKVAILGAHLGKPEPKADEKKGGGR